MEASPIVGGLLSAFPIFSGHGVNGFLLNRASETVLQQPVLVWIERSGACDVKSEDNYGDKLGATPDAFRQT